MAGQGDRPSVLTEFDLVVLSDGIHAGDENSRIAEVYRLTQDNDGFLKTVDTDSGIYVCGAARAPMKIDEAYADAIAVAGSIIHS
jgi:heterodisulfide reductase subunit A-like polyferredoxin